MDLKNKSLDEVKHPETRAKLDGIQEMVLKYDEQIKQIQQSIHEKRGVVSAASVIGKRVMQECGPIQQKIDTEQITPEVAKLLIAHTQHIAAIVQEIEERNKLDVVLSQGKLLAFEDAIKMNENKWTEVLGKYERWQRIEAEEKAETEELYGKAEPAVVQPEVVKSPRKKRVAKK